jgi:hypothetical protein
MKPAHLRRRRYIIRWVRAFTPSNSLAVLYGIAQTARDAWCSVRMSRSTVTVIDEASTRVKAGRLIARMRRNGGLATDRPHS